MNKEIKQRTGKIGLLILLVLFTLTSVLSVTSQLCSSSAPCPAQETTFPLGEGFVVTDLQCGETRWYYFDLPRSHECNISVAFTLDNIVGTSGLNNYYFIKYDGTELAPSCNSTNWMSANSTTQPKTEQCLNIIKQTPHNVSKERILINITRDNASSCNNSQTSDLNVSYQAICTTSTTGLKSSSLWTNTGGNFTYQLYEGAYDYNSTFDFNDDSKVDDDDYQALLNYNESFEGLFWTPLIDFNAAFGVYEKLLDYTLGFQAYLGKIVNGAMPAAWFITADGDGRCSPGENSSNDDCNYCNEDGFCSVNEADNNCAECDGIFPIEPTHSEFNCPGSTNFNTIADLENVVNLSLEGTYPGCNDGRIDFFETKDLTQIELGEYVALNLDSAVDIGPNSISVNTIIAPQLAMDPDISIYNLTTCHPLILKNGLECEDCEELSYEDPVILKEVYSIYAGDIITNVTGMTFTLELNGTNYTYGYLTQSGDFNQINTGQDSIIKITVDSGEITKPIVIDLDYNYGGNIKVYLPDMEEGQSVFVAEDGSTYYDLDTIAKAVADPLMINSTSNTYGPHGKSTFEILSADSSAHFGTIDKDGVFVANQTITSNEQVAIKYTSPYPTTITINGTFIYLPPSYPGYNTIYPATDGSTYEQKELVNIVRAPPINLITYARNATNLTFNVDTFDENTVTTYTTEELVPNVISLGGDTTNFCFAKDNNKNTNELEIKDAVIEKVGYFKMVFLDPIDVTKLDLSGDISVSLVNEKLEIIIDGPTKDIFENEEVIITAYELNITHPLVSGTVTEEERLRYYLPPSATVADLIFKTTLAGGSPINITISDIDNPTTFNEPIENKTIRNGTQEIKINVSDKFEDLDVPSENLVFGVIDLAEPVKIVFEPYADIIQAIIRPLTRFFTPFDFIFTAYDNSSIIPGDVTESNLIDISVDTNRPPVQIQTIPTIEFDEDEYSTLDLSEYFEDHDEHFLYYSWHKIDSKENITIHRKGVSQNIWWNISNASYDGAIEQYIHFVIKNETDQTNRYGYIDPAYFYFTDDTSMETDLLKIIFTNISEGIHYDKGTINITYDNNKKLTIYIPEITDPNSNNKSLYVGKDGSTYYDKELTQVARYADDLIVEPFINITADANWHGTRTIVFKANDTIDTKTSNNVQIIVNPINDAPDLVNEIDDIIMLEGGNETIENLIPYHFYDVDIGTENENITLIYSKPNGDPAEHINITFTNDVYESGDNPINATVKPFLEEWNGFEELKITATDSHGIITSSNIFAVYVGEISDPVTIKVNATNTTNMTEDEGPYNISGEDIFVDSDDDALFSYEVNETLFDVTYFDITSGDITFKPISDYCNNQTGCSEVLGYDNLTLFANDATSSVNQTIKLIVNCTADAPQIEPKIYVNFSEDVNYTSTTEYGYDPDKAYGCDNVTVSYPSYSNVRVNLTDNEIFKMDFIPEKNWFGIEVINVTLVDSYGLVNITEITINVTAVDDETINNTIPTLTWAEDTNKTINISEYIWDIDSVLILNTTSDLAKITPALFLQSPITTLPLVQEFLQEMIITPVTNWSGKTWLYIFAKNKSGEIVASQNITLNVTAVNDAPVCLSNLSNQIMYEDSELDVLVENNFLDVDGDNLTFTFNGTGINYTIQSNGWKNETILLENINSVVEFNETLYAGGENGKIFMFNGYEWNNITNTTITETINSMIVHNNILYTAGENGEVNMYDGSWNNVFEFTNVDLYAMEIYNGTIWIGGDEGEIFMFNGTKWINKTNLFVNSDVREMKNFNGKLYVGQTVGNYNEKIDYFDGEWHNIVNEPHSGDITAIEEYNGKLYVADSDGIIARLESEIWEEQNGTNDETIRSMTVFNNILYTAGENQEIDMYDGDWTDVTNTTILTGDVNELFVYENYNRHLNNLYLFTFSEDEVDSYAGTNVLKVVPENNWFGNTTIEICANDTINETCCNFDIEILPVDDAPTFTNLNAWINSIDVNTDSSDVDNLQGNVDNLFLEVYNDTIENNGTLLCDNSNVTQYVNASCEFDKPDNGTYTIYGYLQDSTGLNASNNPLSVTYEMVPPTVVSDANERYWFNSDNGTIEINSSDTSGLSMLKYCISPYYEDSCEQTSEIVMSGTSDSVILNVSCNASEIMCRRMVYYTTYDMFGNSASGTGRVNSIYDSLIYNTSVNGTTSSVTNGSIINNSNVINSTLTNVTYDSVTIKESDDKNSIMNGVTLYANPSILENNKYYGVSSILHSKIKNSTITDSDISTSEVCNMIITNAVIENGIIIIGNVTWNGTVYTNTSNPELKLKDADNNCIPDVFQPTPIITPPTSSGGGGGGSGGGSSCRSNWQCSDWSECNYLSGSRTRTCVDTKCGKTFGKPAEQEFCRASPKCDDGLKNNGETGIDCGGACEPCESVIIPSKPIIEKPSPIIEEPEIQQAGIEEEQKTPWWFILLLIMLIVAVLGFVVADIRKKQTMIPTVADETPVKVSPTPVVVKKPEPKKSALMVDVKELEKSIQAVLVAGFTIEDIKLALMKKGWDERTVDFAIKEAVIKKYKLHEPHGELEKLEKSISSVVGHGFTCQNIRGSLVKKGWPRDVVDEALHETVIRREDLHLEHDDNEKLVNSIKAVRCHGYTKESIKKKLIAKGWPKAKVENAMKKVA